MIPPQTVVHLLEQYGYAVLFFVAIFEGPIITIIGAFLASQGYFNVLAVYVTVAVADLSGDLLYYGLGRMGSADSLRQVRRFLRLPAADLAQIKCFIEQHGAKFLLVAKYTQTGFLALPACGAARMPITKFVWYNALGTIPKSLALLIVGYFLGYAYNQFDSYFSKAAIVIFGILTLAAAYMWIHRHLRVRFGDG